VASSIRVPHHTSPRQTLSRCGSHRVALPATGSNERSYSVALAITFPPLLQNRACYRAHHLVVVSRVFGHESGKRC
jgi:hypothetical protein